MTLKSMATQKPLTLNPETKVSAIKMIIAFITNRKSPKVRMVTGKVNRIRMGFTIKFNRARTMATIIAAPYPDMETPGRNLERNTTMIAVRSMRNIKIIVVIF